MRTLRSVLELFPAARTSGLTDAEAAASLARFGPNRLTPLPREPVWRALLAKFDEPIIKILLGASLLKIAVDLFEVAPAAGVVALGAAGILVVVAYLARLARWVPALLFALAAALFGLSAGLGHPSVEGLAVMIAVALATGVSFLSEYRSDREFEKLNAGKDDVRVKVVRAGTVVPLPLEQVVIGDLIRLEPGDEVPADGRVVRATELMLDQSLMTGESEPARKAVGPDEEAADPDSPGCVYRGTHVVDGLSEMVITNVGDDTMLGQLARRLSGDDADESAARVGRRLTVSKDLTPLQEKLAVLAGLISKVGYAAAAAVFFALVVRGAFFADPREVFVPGTGPEALAVARSLLGYFVYMVIVIVVAVPEGLPMSVTVSLALAMRKMTRANSLVRQLVACETIGSATVICTDKTGTLTRNRMRVERAVVDGQDVRSELDFATLKAQGLQPLGMKAIDWLGLNAAVNSTATLGEKDGKPIVVGNTTEGALLHWLGEHNADYRRLRDECPPEDRAAFSPDRKTMTTVVRVGGRLIVLVKGAPEAVLDRSATMLSDDGNPRALTPADRDELTTKLAAAAGRAMRTLAFAHTEIPDGTTAQESLAAPLTFVGFVVIRDPLRGDVRAAVHRCRDAGIEVVMITGDNAHTARAIAEEAGLLNEPGGITLTSDELEKLTDEELTDRLPQLRVVARAKPLDKYRLVRLFQERGHVVAMTGDGTNDAPALKKADVGLAMGLTGTEVAKEASKIVLLDDAFSTIVKAVHWGRALYENIQRFVQFQLTINVSALAIAMLCPLLFGFEPPFTVLQLLWINVIMDTFAAIALCSEPPRAGLMRVPPKRRDESLLTPAMKGNVLVTAGFFVVVMLVLLRSMAGAPDAPGLFARGGPDEGWLVRAGADKDVLPAAVLHRGDDSRWTAPAADGSRRLCEVHFTAHQVTLFFTIYVFFQVWNQINCRSLTPEVSGLRGLWRNPYFLAIASLTVIGQVLIVTFGGRVFDVEPLGLDEWLAVAGATASVLVFAEAARFVRTALAGRSR